MTLSAEQHSTCAAMLLCLLAPIWQRALSDTFPRTSKSDHGCIGPSCRLMRTCAAVLLCLLGLFATPAYLKKLTSAVLLLIILHTHSKISLQVRLLDQGSYLGYCVQALSACATQQGYTPGVCYSYSTQQLSHFHRLPSVHTHFVRQNHASHALQAAAGKVLPQDNGIVLYKPYSQRQKHVHKTPPPPHIAPAPVNLPEWAHCLTSLLIWNWVQG